MTTRQLTLHQVTRLAVTIVIENDTGVLNFSFLLVTGMLAIYGHLTRWGTSLLREVRQLIRDVREAVKFTAKVLAIAGVSSAHGLGLIR